MLVVCQRSTFMSQLSKAVKLAHKTRSSGPDIPESERNRSDIEAHTLSRTILSCSPPYVTVSCLRHFSAERYIRLARTQLLHRGDTLTSTWTLTFISGRRCRSDRHGPSMLADRGNLHIAQWPARLVAWIMLQMTLPVAGVAELDHRRMTQDR